MTLRAFYPGSFDPVHNGHLDVIERALKFADSVVIGVGVHPGKKPLFTAQERIALIEEDAGIIAQKMGKELSVVTFDNLSVDAARDNGADIIIRGLRDSTDFNYEAQMDGMNAQMAPDLETIYLSASPEVRHIAANLIRQIAGMKGDVSHFVSENVLAALNKKNDN